MDDSLPGRHLSELGAVLVDLVPRKLAAASVDIDLISTEPTSALPDEATDPEDDDDGESEISLEETLGIVEAATDGADGSVQRGDEDEDVEAETEVRAPDTTDGAEWDLVEGVALASPRGAEADVSETDGAPGEECGKAGQGEEPVEDGRAVSGQANVGEGGEGEDEKDGVEGAAGAVDVGENLGSIALLGESGEGAGTAVDTRNTNGQDRNQDDDVHERVEAVEVGILADKHEGRGLDVDVGVGAEKVVAVVGDQEANKGKTQNVEEGDTPEDLLDGTGERLDGVASLSSGETDKLGTGEGESSSDEDAAEPAESVGKCARLLPELAARVAIVSAALGTATANKDNAEDHEDDCRSKLQHGRPELFLGISKGSKNVDDDDGDEENSNPDAYGEGKISLVPNHFTFFFGLSAGGIIRAFRNLPTLMSSFQYCTVIPQTVSSSGTTTAHCMT